MFCGHAHFYHKVEYSGSVIYALDLANKEYYVLDTATGKLDVIKVDPELFT